MTNGIVWYGERGVVNALVIDLAGRQDVVGGVKDLLRAIRWADGGTREWIDSVSGVSFLVEVGMGQFGNPDLILVCRTGTEATTHVVFVEAKVVPYLGSAMSNADDTMKASEFNSSINGQLTLRHRLAHALHGWGGNGALAEAPNLHAAYHLPAGGLDDPARQPRGLAKAAVLDLVRRHGLHRLPLDHYHLVAWTWDAGPFFSPAVGVSPDQLPLFLTTDGRENWGVMSGRVGWVGFREMAGVCTGDSYRHAVATMLPALVPTAAPSSLEEGEDLKTVNFSEFAGETMQLVAEVEEVARAHFGRECVGRAAGSVSVKVGGRVQLKIIPVDPGGAEKVLLGIRSNLSPRDWCPHDLAGPQRLIGVGPRRKAFHLHALGGVTGEPLVDAAEIFQLVADRFPSTEQT